MPKPVKHTFLIASPHDVDKGFTLLEIMIALLLFSVGLLAVATLQVSSMNQNTDALQGTTGSIVASVFLEEILNMDFDHFQLSDPDNGFFPDSPDQGPIPAGKSNATVEWEVDDGFAAPDTKHIALTVRWKASSGRSCHLTYHYVKSKDY